MSDDEKDVFEEARENSDQDLFTDLNTLIKTDEPEVNTVARTSVAEIPEPVKSSVCKEEKMVPRSGQYIHIKVYFPEKVGSGMSSYFAYKVVTNTNKPSFLKQELIVKRRFSDFLALHEKLESKYLSVGCIIPQAPEKDAIGNTKTKFGREEQAANNEFLERRRGILERYLQRIAKHPRLVVDNDFREFLEEEGELSRPAGTLSGNQVKKLMRSVGDAMGRMTTQTEDSDRWFEDKQVEMDNLERHLSAIHSSFDALISQRKELVSQSRTFAQFCSQLSHVEEHNGLARALAQLSTTQEDVAREEERQAEEEIVSLLGVLKEYLGLVGGVKAVMMERRRQFRAWQDAEVQLNKKREQKVRAELSSRIERIPALENEIKDAENRVDRTKEDFDNISKAIKKELEVFDTEKINDFKESIIKVLKSMISCQEEIIQHWEKFAPETTGISS